MKKWLLSIPIILITSNIYGATITWSKDFADGQTLSGSDFDNLQTDITAVVNAGGGPVTLTANQTISGDNTFSGTSTFSGAISATGNTTLGNAVTDNTTLTGAIQGASPFILDGATDDTATVTIAIYDEGTSVTYGISDMAESGSFIMSTLDNTLGDLDDANAIWGESNNLVFEGATANGFETRVSTDDVGADQTINISQQSVRGWANFTGTGTPAYNDSFNITGSITDNGAGDWTISWDVDFSNANYVVAGSCDNTGGNNPYFMTSLAGKAVGSLEVFCRTDGGSFVDEIVSVMAIGDQT